MLAIKDNKIYTITTDKEAEEYKAKGYDIKKDDGSIEYSATKKVSYSDYKKLLEENKKLKAENKKLKKTTSEEK